VLDRAVSIVPCRLVIIELFHSIVYLLDEEKTVPNCQSQLRAWEARAGERDDGVSDAIPLIPGFRYFGSSYTNIYVIKL
jgi:hypothetical protein